MKSIKELDRSDLEMSGYADELALRNEEAQLEAGVMSSLRLWAPVVLSALASVGQELHADRRSGHLAAWYVRLYADEESTAAPPTDSVDQFTAAFAQASSPETVELLGFVDRTVHVGAELARLRLCRAEAASPATRRVALSRLELAYGSARRTATSRIVGG